MLASIGATRVFAAGGVGAIAVTYWCFRRARFSADDALVRVLGFNTLFYVAFAVGAWTAALVTATGALGRRLARVRGAVAGSRAALRRGRGRSSRSRAASSG